MNALKVVFFLFCCFFFSNVSADVGCYVPSSGYLYPERVPGQPNYTSKTKIFMGEACTPGNTGSSTTCFVNGGVGNGFEGDYSPTNCPIDSEVWILLSATGLLGCFFVRRKYSLDFLVKNY
jgi:hypothetical protein